MKPDDLSSQSKIDSARKSIVEKATIKDGMRVGIILTGATVILLVFMALGVQYVDFVVPDMILYNNTGHEIEIHLGGHITGVWKDSIGRVDQPVPCRSPIVILRECQKGYKRFSVGTVQEKWSYEVVYPPADYKKRWSSTRIEYRYQIEADGSIYILKPGSEYPVRRLPPQPPGFPLVRKASWGGKTIVIQK